MSVTPPGTPAPDFALRGEDGRTVTRADLAFKERLGVTIEQLSDWEPKGETCRAFGIYHEGGSPQRALAIIGPDGVVRWSHQAADPGELPGANLIFGGLDAV